MAKNRTPPRPQDAQSNAEEGGAILRIIWPRQDSARDSDPLEAPVRPAVRSLWQPVCGRRRLADATDGQEPVAQESAVVQGVLRGGAPGWHDPDHRGALRRCPQLNRPRRDAPT